MNKFLFFLLCIWTVNASAQWEIQNQIPDTLSVTDVFFTNDSCGWAVGNNVRLKTLDAGNSWIVDQYLSSIYGDTYYQCVFFTDESHGWVAGEKIIIGGGVYDIVYHTSDAGDNWTQQLHDGGNGFNDLFFIDNNKGFATSWISLVSTTNGGENWEYTPMPVISVYFPNDEKGWAGGGTGQIFHSDNGGASWNVQYESQDSICIMDIYFTEDSCGWVVGYNIINETGIVLRTINGGQSWVESGTFNEILRGVKFVDIDSGWVIGSNGTIFYTTDGGLSWIDQSIISGHLQKIIITDNFQGWIVGQDGLYHSDLSSILRTEDLENNLKVNIYPNPAHATITIELPTQPSKNTSLTLFNINGQQLITRPNTEPQAVIDVSGLPSGIYFVKVVDDEQVMVGKVIKE